jgi:serine/threonine protein kinase
MSAPSWSDLETLFHEALACAPADRAAFLNERCAGRPALQAEVAALLRAHDNAPGDLEAARVTLHPQLQRGARLGPFEVVAPLGAGGMGEVYRARDTRLGRDVAIKILPTIFTKDPERRARLEREAHVLAALNHPNIGAIYGFEDSGDVGALVLELIEGPTLADRLAQGALPVTDVLEIASQITAALEAAHEKGIIHRDLKPANIKLRPDGAVKVLDFGLAKVVAGDGSAPDLSRPPLTGQEGVILGTLGYMSPEQARGKAADTRTDVWAFGCVLYEMLSGRLAFQRATTSETIAAVLECEPDFAALPPDTPAGICRLLRRCLQKDPRQRLRDIGDARLEIAEALARPNADVAVDAAQSRRSRRGRVVAYAVAASVIIVALGWVVARPTPPPPAPVVRFIVTPPSDLSPVSPQNATQNVAISADGTQLAYRSTDGAIVRSLDDVVLTPLRPIGLAQPFFLSPDGRWLGFLDDNGLQKVPVAGGPAVVVAAARLSAPGFLGGGASWGPDDVIVFADDDGLSRVSAGGGVPERLLALSRARSRERPAWPGLLPGGHSALFTVITEGTGEEGARLEVLDVNTGTRKTIVRGASRGRYVPTGHLLYASRGGVFAVAFDLERMETQGEPVAMVTDASDNSFAVSDTGTLMYLSGTTYAANTLTWVDRQGRETPLAAPPRAYTYPRLSPDETRVALDIGGSNRDIWIWDLRRESLDLFTLNDASANPLAAWSPDGRQLTVVGFPNGCSTLRGCKCPVPLPLTAGI